MPAPSALVRLEPKRTLPSWFTVSIITNYSGERYLLIFSSLDTSSRCLLVLVFGFSLCLLLSLATPPHKSEGPEEIDGDSSETFFLFP